jgi:hypothetical protein
MEQATPANSDDAHAGPAGPLPVLPLGYEPPQPSSGVKGLGVDDLLIGLFRRAVFAVGVGLLTAGLIMAFGTQRYRDANEFAGWGAALVALVVPFPALWRHWPRRR